MNRRSLVCPLLLLATVASFAPSASASSPVDPNVLRALDLGSMRGVSARARSIAPKQGAEVLIELNGPLSDATKRRLQSAGITFGMRAGRAAGLQRFVAATIDRATLKRLVAMPEVVRISHVPPRGPLPLQYTTALLDIASARGAHESIDQLTGRGMLVADTDSNADVFHPHLFHADGGYYDWIDVNDNDVFDPGIDAIDFDADGESSPAELGLALSAGTYTYYGSSVPARDAQFDPSLDWVYLDDNDNGKRDYGAEAGFTDDVPAFGEPLFVPDDVNQNGKLDVGERFVRLGTSKIRKVRTSASKGYLTEVRYYERGVDLSSHVNELSDSSQGDASHGTSVLSILLGDVPLVGRRNVGLAPEAEAVLSADLGGDGVQGATWMLDEKPDVALWEMAPWTGLPLDGTDPYSQLVDATAQDDDVVHSCPVGNTGGSGKHAYSQIPAGQLTTLSFENPSYLEPMYIEVSLNFRGAADMGVLLRAPDGTEIDITGNAGQQFEPIPGVVAYPTVQTTQRGTYFVDTILYAYKVPQLPGGTWQLEIEGHASDDATLNAYLMDEISGWGEGVRFSYEQATDTSTIGAPAAADHAIAVGAFTGHPSTAQQPWFYGEEPPGHVRGYSGRGPRIDGTARLDVVAPDNPFAAAPATPDYYGYGEVLHGGFWVFGGTSGAGPHVAGVALLLAQAGIRGDAAREAIRTGATNDAVSLADPDAYGAGRLSAAGALGVEPSAGAPTVSVALEPSPAVVGQEATLRLSLTDPGHPGSSLVTRWDDGYDGTWDTPYESSVARTIVHDQVGSYPYKVRVRNPEGRVAEAVIWVEVAEKSPEPVDAGAEGGMDGGADAGPTLDTAGPLKPGGGCGCRVSGEERPTRGIALLISLLGVAVARGRRRRRS